MRRSTLGFLGLAPLLWLHLVAVSAASAVVQAQDSDVMMVDRPPPLIPVYEQPAAPGEDYIWTPGYWAWDSVVRDYYWVPGAWVMAPQPGLLWTPGYWQFRDTGYVWLDGYWGPVVGFYGGIDYGAGYFGIGYFGGHWKGKHFAYNTAVSHVDAHVIRNTYSQAPLIRNKQHVSYHGGPGGVPARPMPAELRASESKRLFVTEEQLRRRARWKADASNRASVNHGRPTTLALAGAGRRASATAEQRQAPRPDPAVQEGQRE